MQRSLSRRELLKYIGIGSAATVLAACQPKVVEVERIVEKEVEKLVEQTVVVKEAVEVEKEVTRVVEVDKQAEAPVAPADREPVDIVVHTNLGYQWWGWIEKAWEENVGGFRDINPHINMVGEPVAGWTADYFPKIFSLVASGTLGDIAWFPPRMRNHISWGVLYSIVMDHMPFVEAENYDLGQFFPGVIASSTFQGRLYWMPFRNEGTQPVIGYHIPLAEELGMPEPQDDFTFDELIEWAKIGTQGDVWGYGSGARGFNAWAAELKQFGVEVIDEEGVTAFPGNSVENLKKAMQYTYDLSYTHEVAPKPEHGARHELWFAKRTVAMPMNVGHMTSYPIQANVDQSDVGFIYPPVENKGDRRRSNLNEHVHGVTRSSQHPEDAWTWLKWHSSKEFNVGGILSGMVGAVGRPDVFADPRVQEAMPTYAKLAAIMPDIEPDWFALNYRGNELEAESNVIMEQVMLGELAIDQAAELLAEECQLILDKPPA